MSVIMIKGSRLEWKAKGRRKFPSSFTYDNLDK